LALTSLIGSTVPRNVSSPATAASLRVGTFRINDITATKIVTPTPAASRVWAPFGMCTCRSIDLIHSGSIDRRSARERA
jgi:hypothetical protein